MTESALVRTLLLASSKAGATLFRNARGVERIAQKDCPYCQRAGRVVSYGLANGAPDLVGWQTVTIGPKHLGARLAIFCGVEVKRPDGTLRPAQRAFLEALARAGAVAGVVRSVDDLEALLVARREDTTVSSGIRKP